MPRGLFVVNQEKVVLQSYELPELGDEDVRIKVKLATIKHGTEFAAFSGKSPFDNNRFDLEKRPLQKNLWVIFGSGRPPML